VLISMETSAARNAALPIVSKGKAPYIYTSFYEGAVVGKLEASEPKVSPFSTDDRLVFRRVELKCFARRQR
jgi:hypothetical protein